MIVISKNVNKSRKNIKATKTITYLNISLSLLIRFPFPFFKKTERYFDISTPKVAVKSNAGIDKKV